MRFTKLHGCGNDYLYVDCFNQPAPADPAELSRQMSERHFGVGSDGLILVMPSKIAEVKMRMFNADGSEGEMCGNGIRGLAKFAFDRGLVKANPMRVETLRGVLTLVLQLDQQGRVGMVTVDMGAPSLQLKDIPVDQALVRKERGQHAYSFETNHVASVGVVRHEAVFVNIGNPHAVIFTVSPLVHELLTEYGRVGETYNGFPKRMNIHFAWVISQTELGMQTWERGSGITLACGTGASAVCVAGVLTGRTERKVLIHLPGGDLNIDWRESDDHVYMTGPAVEVFSGEWPG